MTPRDPERPRAGAVRLATRMHDLVPSAVREILKVAERPEVISLAGGLPAPELFPVADLEAAFAQTFASEARAALQYGVTEGHRPLREWLAGRARRQGVSAHADELLVIAGAQQGIDLVAKVLLDPGDVVLVEAPTYLAAVQVFASYQARLVPVPSDDDGMRVELLEESIRRHRPALIYLVPEFQNPKGTSLAVNRRRRLVELARRNQLPILEDDPYGELRFEGAFRPPLAALDEDGWVIRLGTFSKTLAPGLRLGWVHARGELIRRLTIAKQATDLHTGILVQRAVAKLLENFDYDAHLDQIRTVYRARRDAMLAALERTMPPAVHWTRPEGGLFLWMQLPPGVRDETVCRAALADGVAVVPGQGFFSDGAETGFVRLNYSNQSPERIVAGVERLAVTIARLIRAERLPSPAVGS